MWIEVKELQRDYGQIEGPEFEDLLRRYRTDAGYANQYRPNKTSRNLHSGCYQNAKITWDDSLE